MAEITLRDLKDRATKTPEKVFLGLTDLSNVSDPYAKFVELVDMAIDWIAQDLARNPELRQGLSEDQLTVQLVLSLKSMSFDASHEMKVGGHCDILIEARDEMLWLGEAKKIKKTNNAWLYKGFEQLNSRYSTGALNQDSGGIIIYCFAPRIDQIMSSWKKYLTRKFADLTTSPCAINPFAFRSEHVHMRMGRRFKVRHTPISLHFEPKDRDL